MRAWPVLGGGPDSGLSELSFGRRQKLAREKERRGRRTYRYQAAFFSNSYFGQLFTRGEESVFERFVHGGLPVLEGSFVGVNS
jgi:hypothetical protein